MPASEIEIIVEQLRANPIGGSLEEMRAGMDETAVPVAEDINVQAIDIDGIPCELYTPPGADTQRVIMFTHGGGFLVGSLISHRAMISELARASGCQALAVEYRLSPEHVFPAALEDATAAYLWLLKNGYSADKIAFSGDSAGGGLTIGTLISLRDSNHPLPAAAVCLSPWIDLEITGESHVSRKDLDPMITSDILMQMGQAYIGAGDIKSPSASPINADLTGLPPLLIQVGSAETLFSDSERLAQNAQSAGIEVTLEEWPDMVHVWHMFFPQLADARKAISRAGEFIKDKLGA